MADLVAGQAEQGPGFHLIAAAAAQGLFDGGPDSPWHRPPLERRLREVLAGGASLVGFRVAGQFPGLGERVLLLNATRVAAPSQPPRLLLSVEDASDGHSR